MRAGSSQETIIAARNRFAGESRIGYDGRDLMKSGHAKKSGKAVATPSPPVRAEAGQRTQPLGSPQRRRLLLAGSALLILPLIAAVIVYKNARRPASDLNPPVPSAPAAGAEALAVALAKPSAAEDAQQKAAQLTNRGNQLLARETLRRDQAYQEALALTPQDEDCITTRRRLRPRRPREEAEKHYREALRIFADYPEVHNNSAIYW